MFAQIAFFAILLTTVPGGYIIAVQTKRQVCSGRFIVPGILWAVEDLHQWLEMFAIIRQVRSAWRRWRPKWTVPPEQIVFDLDAAKLFSDCLWFGCCGIYLWSSLIWMPQNLSIFVFDLNAVELISDWLWFLCRGTNLWSSLTWMPWNLSLIVFDLDAAEFIYERLWFGCRRIYLWSSLIWMPRN